VFHCNGSGNSYKFHCNGSGNKTHISCWPGELSGGLVLCEIGERLVRGCCCPGGVVRGYTRTCVHVGTSGRKNCPKGICPTQNRRENCPESDCPGVNCPRGELSGG